MYRPSAAVVCLSVFAVFYLLAGAGCSESERVTPPGPPADTWRLGPETAYRIDSASETGVADSVTGAQFLFPQGGQGTLRVSRILSGPPAPLPGRGFAVSFEEEVPILLVVDPSGDEVVTVLGHGTAPGAYDDIPGPALRWIAVPLVDTLDSRPAFQLNLPLVALGPVSGPIAATNIDRVANRTRLTADGGFSHYWITSIPAGSNEATRRVQMQLQAGAYVDGILSRLSPARSAAAEAEVRGRMRVNYAWDGIFYTGFWWRSLGSLGRIVRPTVHLTLAADAGNIAHETGHYLTHVLVGDDAWSTLEGQAPLWDTGHGIRDEIGRNVLLEDYAYFMEWLVIGSVNGYDLLDPYPVFSGLSPLTEDYPGLEGFAAVMLASLTRTSPSMRDLAGGRPVDVPVVGLSEAEVFDIIAEGATGIEDLRARVAAAVGPQADKLPAILQRSGWRHSVTGRLIDENGAAVAGATVASLSIVGEREYRGGTSSIPSDAQGRFEIPGEVFPGDSRIRVWNGQDSIDVAITIPWTSRTDQTVDLGDLQVRKSVNLAPLKYCTVDLFTRVFFDADWGSGTEYRRTGVSLRGGFTGGLFVAARDTTGVDSIRIVEEVTADVDPITGLVKTVAFTQTRAGPGAWSATIKMSGVNVEMASYNVYGPNILMECRVDAVAACGHITRYEWDEQADTTWVHQTGHSCAPDRDNGYVSTLAVYFHKQRQF